MASAVRSGPNAAPASVAAAQWFAGAIDRVAGRVPGDAPAGAARALAQALGVAGFLERAGLDRFARPDGEARTHRLHDTLLLEAAAQLSDAWHARGIPHAFIKGGGLLGRVYAPGDRTLVDLDVLVRPADARRALRVLREHDYAVPAGARRDAPPAMRRGRTLVRGGRTGLDDVTVDLNWAAARADRLLTYPDHEALEPLWDRLDAVGPLPVPAAGHHLALVIHHLVVHDLLHARGLLDAALLVERLTAVDREVLSRMARRLRVRRAVAAAMRVIEPGVSGMPGPAPAATGWRDRQLAASLDPAALISWSLRASLRDHREITHRRIRKRVVLVDRWRDVLALGRDIVAPPAAYRRWRWPGARTTVGAWLLHIRRVSGKGWSHGSRVSTRTQDPAQDAQ